MAGGCVCMIVCAWGVELRKKKPNEGRKLLSRRRPDYRGHSLIHTAGYATVWNNNNSRSYSRRRAALMFMHIRYPP